ncbi:sulfotransferase domain-containing protein [Alteribacillus bidgolensis]|uniref:Sulfotransferase domain-containing protein n=1 Tax=Alteribacillus bidgolensis TaxID=930129 RepID=A0A1G8I1G8_9BACI|nr:sulfotransferase domain-containing protein [Alteribacillus bidgolensis]SDI12835.1 Sulfotransferase domain-containing protein [Alteribacillus bidgolensis]
MISEIKIPAFFVNSIPKSGTNLLKQLLLGIPGLSHIPSKHEFYGGRLNQDARLRLQNMKPKEFGAGHVMYSMEWANLFKELNMKQIIISRDPRDIVVSYVQFIKRFPTLSPFFSFVVNNLKTDKERYLTIIRGLANMQRDINGLIRGFIGWFNNPNTLHITFESLVSSVESQNRTLNQIVSFLIKSDLNRKQIINKMKQNIIPAQSLTFRKGIIGDWKNEFDSETIDTFKKVAGQLLIELGYEQDLHW